MVPADDQAIVLPWASVMVIIVLLKDAFTCATPDAMFLRSRRRTRVASLPIHDPFAARLRNRHRRTLFSVTRPSAPFPNFVIPPSTLPHELRKRRSTSNSMIPVRLFDLK